MDNTRLDKGARKYGIVGKIEFIIEHGQDILRVEYDAICSLVQEERRQPLEAVSRHFRTTR
jgi:hypothetical protein